MVVCWSLINFQLVVSSLLVALWLLLCHLSVYCLSFGCLLVVGGDLSVGHSPVGQWSFVSLL